MWVQIPLFSSWFKSSTAHQITKSAASGFEQLAHKKGKTKMHDKNGTELKVGDIVLMPATITHLSPEEDYCNVTIETIHGGRPNGKKSTMSAINTAVLVLHDRQTEAA